MHKESSTVEVIETDAELEEVLNRAAKDAGFTIEDLRVQAKDHRFMSEKARMAWFVISSLSDQEVA